MYQIGDYVVKAGAGVCRIEDIVHLELSDVDQKKEFFFLVPVEDKGAKVYVPVDKAQSELRYVIDEEEAAHLLQEIPEIQAAVIDNEKLREQAYKSVIRSCDLTAEMGILKNMYRRKMDRLARGKSTTAMDDRYYRMAEKALVSELAFALGVSKESICKQVTELIAMV